jgi:hypothetical protein
MAARHDKAAVADDLVSVPDCLAFSRMRGVSPRIRLSIETDNATNVGGKRGALIRG